jgi:nucleoside-diphosphate-sugar epimerase
MSTVVFGGAGFIGRRLITLLAGQGEKIICADINVDADTFASYGSQVDVVRTDVSRFDEVSHALERAGRPDRIVNLAYSMGTGHQPHVAFQLNILGMENIFEAARVREIPRVVFASSLAVNGPQACFGERPVTETDHTYGTNQYATHKIFNESQARDYRVNHGLEITAVRPANVTGADKVLGSMDHVQAITKPAVGQPVQFPFRDAMRCPIDVDDVAEILARLTLLDRPKHAIYNTGGHPISIGEIVDLVATLLPSGTVNAAFQHDHGGKELSLNPHQDSYLIDNCRLMDEIDFRLTPYPETVHQMANEVRAAQGLQKL